MSLPLATRQSSRSANFWPKSSDDMRGEQLGSARDTSPAGRRSAFACAEALRRTSAWRRGTRSQPMPGWCGSAVEWSTRSSRYVSLTSFGSAIVGFASKSGGSHLLVASHQKSPSVIPTPPRVSASATREGQGMRGRERKPPTAIKSSGRRNGSWGMLLGKCSRGMVLGYLNQHACCDDCAVLK